MEGSERELVASLKSGSAQAFDAVYDLHRTRLFSFLLRMTGRRDLAEDLFQETWLRLASHARGLADDTHVLPWLFTVARNLYRSHLRWSALDARRIDRLSLEPAHAPTTAPTPEHVAAEAETRRRLERAIATLPPLYREAILLVAVERLRPADAAVVLSIRPEALRQRLARARARLATAIDEHDRMRKVR